MRFYGLFGAAKVTAKALAREYGVGLSTVYGITRRVCQEAGIR